MYLNATLSFLTFIQQQKFYPNRKEPEKNQTTIPGWKETTSIPEGWRAKSKVKKVKEKEKFKFKKRGRINANEEKRLTRTNHKSFDWFKGHKLTPSLVDENKNYEVRVEGRDWNG